jgi:hypothetical protein
MTGSKLAAALLTAFSFTPALWTAAAQANRSQTGPPALYERTFHQPKSAVQKALEGLQSAMSGKLPALEGFAVPGEHPLDRYRRAFYQSSVQLSSTASAECLVRVTTKITAWYADSTASRSGYQLLTSNGRIESDLLDQLTDLLADRANPEILGQKPGKDSAQVNLPAGPSGKGNNSAAEPAISAPVPQSSGVRPVFSPPRESLSVPHQADARNSAASPAQTGLEAEAASLEEVLRNQAHPKNLVAVKKSGTPVLATPSLTGKTLFMADARDEFEMLDFNADWVHVRISGLSRGWIWRTSLEMPGGISDVPLATEHGLPVAADLFQVTREEAAPFPGDWEPLRGKKVKIISVQKMHEDEQNSGAPAKLEFAKSLLDKSFAELSAQSQELAGVVLIFDSVDGGMIAVTLPIVRQWKVGKLSDAGLWHQCYFDPPETFTVASPAAGH